jgi:hypothetical protein
VQRAPLPPEEPTPFDGPPGDVRDVVVRGDWANAALRGARARRVVFEGVRLTGALWTEGSLSDVVFRGCLLDLASFGRSQLDRVVFDDCRLRGADLAAATRRDVRWDGCDLEGLDVGEARLVRCSVRGPLSAVADVRQWRGVALGWEDVVASAEAFAGALGIVVEGG